MIKAKKSLGQNFLVDDFVINQILNIVKINDQYVLEVGPGTGNLTSKILDKNPKKLIVVEKDNQLASLLKVNFGSKIDIINNDILKINENHIENEKLTVATTRP